jgi:hypothetical protein
MARSIHQSGELPTRDRRNLMGARINFVMKAYETEQAHVTLYSHWGETTWRHDLAMALLHAKPRWDDQNYGARIVVSQLIGESWNSETGYGLFTSVDGDDLGDTTVVVDFTNQTVNDTGNEHSFGAFIEYQTEMVEYHA